MLHGLLKKRGFLGGENEENMRIPHIQQKWGTPLPPSLCESLLFHYSGDYVNFNLIGITGYDVVLLYSTEVMGQVHLFYNLSKLLFTKSIKHCFTQLKNKFEEI
jgi:hypothetical protein